MRVYTGMVADMFHYGHMKFIKHIRRTFPEAYIIIGIMSDEDCALYKRKPIITMRERIKSVEESGLADQVIGNAPTVYGHTREEESKYREYYQYTMDHNMLYRTDYHMGISTSEIIQRIVDRNH